MELIFIVFISYVFYQIYDFQKKSFLSAVDWLAYKRNGPFQFVNMSYKYPDDNTSTLHCPHKIRVVINYNTLTFLDEKICNTKTGKQK